jgi:hypothetical protein
VPVETVSLLYHDRYHKSPYAQPANVIEWLRRWMKGRKMPAGPLYGDFSDGNHLGAQGDTMDSQEYQGWEIAKERVADFKREAAQRHLAAATGSEPPIAERLRLIIPVGLGLAGALAWLLIR